MSKTPKLSFSLYCLLFLLLHFFCSTSNAQVKPVTVPSLVNPGGGGGGTPSDEVLFAIPFDCSTAQTANPCNLIRNNGFIRNPVDPANPSDPIWDGAPFSKYIDYWTSSHGTPQINQNTLPINSSTNHASMWADARIDNNGNIVREGEGIAIAIPKLTVNSTYSLSLLKRFMPYGPNFAPDVDNFYVVLLKCTQFQGLRTFGENYTIPNIPAGAQIIYQETDVSNTNWANVTQTFVANDQYDVVWIFPKNSTTAGPNIRLSAWLEVALPEIRNVALCGPPPCSTLTINPSGPIDIYYLYDGGGSVTLTSSSASNNQWYKNGILIPGATNQTFTVNVTGYTTATDYFSVSVSSCISNSVQVFSKGCMYTNEYPVPIPTSVTTTNPFAQSEQVDLGVGSTYIWTIVPSTSCGIFQSCNPAVRFCQIDMSGCSINNTGMNYKTKAENNGRQVLMFPPTVVRNQFRMIQQNILEKGLIYPNPANNQITLTSTEAITSIEISDLMNPTSKRIKVNGTKSTTINVSDLKPGIYNCKITTSKGVENQKLIIKR